jgi:hypothetical protein
VTSSTRRVISSTAAHANYPLVVDKASKAALMPSPGNWRTKTLPSHPRQGHSAGADRHADSGRHPRSRQQREPRRGRRRARCAGVAARPHRYRPGRRQRRRLPRLGRSRLHHRRGSAARRRCAGADRPTPGQGHAARRSSSNAAACVSAARFDEAVAAAGSAPATLAVTVNRGAWSGPLVATSS